MPKKISDVFGISSDELRKQGVFDGFIDIDSKFYVDPRLLEKTEVPELQRTYSNFQKYFSNIFEEIYQKIANETPNQQIIIDITDKLKFPENSLAGLGYSTNNTEGKGIGEKLAVKLSHNALAFTIAGITDPVIFELTQLFEENFGADRISDMTVYIILPELLKFSERVAKNLRIQTLYTSVRNQNFHLPCYLNQWLILVPEDILTKLPLASYDSFNDNDSITLHNQKLRLAVNNIIGIDYYTPSWRQLLKTKKKQQLKELLIKNPKLMIELIEKYKSKKPRSYSFVFDSDNEFTWYTIAKYYAENYPVELKEIGYNFQNFYKNIVDIVNCFSILVSQKDLCIELYNDAGDTISEKYAQLIFLKLVEEYISQNRLSRTSINYDSKSGMIIIKNENINFWEIVILLKYSSNRHINNSFDKFVNYINKNNYRKGIFLLLATNQRYLDIKEELHEISEIEKTKQKKMPEIKLIDGRIKLFGKRKVAYIKEF